MKNCIRYAAAILMLLPLFGCGTMMVLLGDNIRYSISGNVEKASGIEAKGISTVKVDLTCFGGEKSIYQNRKGTTDEKGYYQLSGYWELDGCKLTFTHPDYYPETIIIDKNHLVSSEGLSRTYDVNVHLVTKGHNNK